MPHWRPATARVGWQYSRPTLELIAIIYQRLLVWSGTPNQIKLLSAKFHVAARLNYSTVQLSIHEPDRLWSQTSSRNRNWSLFVRLSTASPCLSLSLHFGCFPGSSLGSSNHSVTVTRRRFPPRAQTRRRSGSSGGYKRRLCVCGEGGSQRVRSRHRWCLAVNLRRTSVLLEYPLPYSTMADRLFTPASVPFCCSVTFRLWRSESCYKLTLHMIVTNTQVPWYFHYILYARLF